MATDGTSPGTTTTGISRRRILDFVAACGLPLALGGSIVPAAERPRFHRWRGRALGASVQLTLAHPEAATVEAVVQRCFAEIIRLEAAFSLFQGESEICRLNRDGRLADASLDFRLVLAESQRLGRLTGGAFDITVQPLWQLYAAHFAAVGPNREGPSERALDTTRRRVDYRQLDITDGNVGFLRPGMAITLNGVAQGYITDRIAMILRNAGFDRVLVDLGEIAALNPPNGWAGWTVRIDDPGGRLQGQDAVVLTNRAIATSSGYATRFDRTGRYHHLFDPWTGQSAVRHLSVSVISRSAILSDALSTALSVLPQQDAARILLEAGAERAIFLEASGQSTMVTA